MNGPKATATMRVDDLLQQHQQQHQFYVNPTHHNPMTNQHHQQQQQAQYSNIGSQNCKFVKAKVPCFFLQIYQKILQTELVE